MKKLLIYTVLILSTLSTLYSEEVFQADDNLDFAQVVKAKAIQNSNGSWTFSVTIRHKDEGWDHYADIWIIVNPDTGEILGSRILAHPHDNEQPFTRSLSGVTIPADLKEVEIRAKCTDHGYEGKRFLLILNF
ncbi:MULTISPECIES: hypothetical protein [unclassified Oceanispirochaeta]|uniref:hypothetical protein n=1 Tax=unclassified Oceanispirochaeta TaxID=2635722 RepID=UPI000E09762F|nr:MULTISPECIES: hypothetical protein [unclassified Oceanispirochaeta]MBF9014942.1 hypothetical protein [Oceanispirochaeta sp. M2]NPD71377.1 hypothetical protein [Oceanispirochaeta sp. M1]RDG33342.1 hypothetical protein DV872_04610 [Oceanispirochaeta sp. M1]